ncbi:MAG: hypothetical protein V1888_03000 [archaeon]
MDRISAEVDMDTFDVVLKYQLKNNMNVGISTSVSFLDVDNISKVLLGDNEVFWDESNKVVIDFASLEKRELEVRYNRVFDKSELVVFDPIIMFNGLRSSYNVEEASLDFTFFEEEFEIYDSNLKYNIAKTVDSTVVNFYDNESEFDGVSFKIRSLAGIILEDTFGVSNSIDSFDERTDGDKVVSMFPEDSESQSVFGDNGLTWVIILVLILFACFVIWVVAKHRLNKYEK